MNEARRWLPRAAFAALVVGVIAVFTLVEHASPLLLPTALLVCAVVAIAGMVSDSGGADPPDWTVPTELAGISTGQDSGLAVNLRLLENHLSARQMDPLLRDRLARLTDDRLASLGLRRGDPGVAQRLGPVLTGVLDGPPRTLQPAEIDECVRRIEELTDDPDAH
jgi:hypothetical protein